MLPRELGSIKHDNTIMEWLLYDRLEAIKVINQKYDLEHNAYLSFSGGKDSTILHHLIDMALPNNRIPRVFINTGIEYQLIVDFVNEMAKADDRFIILKPSTPIKPMLEKNGYPFKSKEFSNIYKVYQRSGKTKSVRKFIREEPSTRKIYCPKALKEMFETKIDTPISDNCCMKLKKEPIAKWQIENNKPIAILGMRQTEGGQRASLKGCVLTDKDGKLKKFYPLVKVNDEWEQWFLETYKDRVSIASLYKEPYNFKRTGCAGCPFALDLQEQLDTMERLLPSERKRCEIIWQPIYDLYRKYNYRLKKEKS